MPRSGDYQRRIDMREIERPHYITNQAERGLERQSQLSSGLGRALKMIRRVSGERDALRQIVERQAIEIEMLRANEERLERENGEKDEKIFEQGHRIVQLEENVETAEHSAYHDSLTKLWNRRKMDEILHESMAAFVREGRTFSIVMLDLDDLKLLNSMHTHTVSDKVLVQMANVIAEHTREGEYSCRAGGDEFAMLFPGKGIREAEKAAARIIGILESEGIHASAGTASIESDIDGRTIKTLRKSHDSTTKAEMDAVLSELWGTASQKMMRHKQMKKENESDEERQRRIELVDFLRA